MAKDETIEAYPLQWPAGRPRTKFPVRSMFKTSMSQATSEVLHEVKLLGGSNLVISTNQRLRQDGLPYMNDKMPADRGVAVYFTYKGKQMCFACDRWHYLQENMHAIALTIGALRGIDRWGSGDMMERAFTGFQALPFYAAEAEDCWSVLGIEPTTDKTVIQAAFKNKLVKAHPDKGGTQEAMAKLNAARDEALRRAA